MPHAFTYCILGAATVSDHEIRCVPPIDAGAKPDVALHAAPLVELPEGEHVHMEKRQLRDGSDTRTAECRLVPASGSAPAYYALWYYPGRVFHVALDGRNVWCPEGGDRDLVEATLMGPVLSFAAALRGTLCIHAGSVVIDDLAYLVAGPRGAGKSTTTVALGLLGHPILGDDVAAITRHSQGYLVQPAYPRLRLWEDSAAALGWSGSALPRLFEGTDKRAVDPAAVKLAICSDPTPLGGIYLLGATEGDACSPVSPGRAFMSLVEHTRETEMLTGPLRARQVSAIGDLVRSTPVRSAPARTGLDQVLDFARLVAQDALTSR